MSNAYSSPAGWGVAGSGQMAPEAERVIRLLANRTDAFGERISSKSKSGWITSKSSLTAEVVSDHLAGEKTIALHARSTHDTCRWCAFDIDAKTADMRESARAEAEQVMEVLRRHGVRFCEEDSNGQEARHLWVVFDCPVSFKDTVAFGEAVKGESGVTCEFFPKQSGGEYAGGLLRLPGRHPEHTDHWSRGRVDGLGEWQSYPDALSLLVDLERVPAALVRRLAGRVDREDGDDGDDGANRDVSAALPSLSALPSRSALSSLSALSSRSALSSLSTRPVISPVAPEVDERVQACIDATQPSGPGQRYGCLFDLARRCRGIRSDWTIEELDSIAHRWWQIALPNITTKDLATTRIDFANAYDRVYLPAGETIDALAGEVDALPDFDFARDFDHPGYVRVIKLILVMDKRFLSPRDEFFLSCRDAARFAGISHQTAAVFLRYLCKRGGIHFVRRPSEYKANRYRLGPALEPYRLPRDA